MVQKRNQCSITVTLSQGHSTTNPASWKAEFGSTETWVYIREPPPFQFNRSTSCCSCEVCCAEPGWLCATSVPVVQHTWLHPSPPAAPPLRSADPGRPGEWAARRPPSRCGPTWRRPPRRASPAVRPVSQPLAGSPPSPRDRPGRFFGPPGRTRPCGAALARTPRRATP